MATHTSLTNLRALKFAVIIMAVLIVLVASAIVAVIVFRLSGGAERRDTPPAAWHIVLPEAQTVVTVTPADEGLVVLVEDPTGRRSVHLIDPKDGRLLGRIDAIGP